MDRVTVVRSMTHDYPLHGVAYAVSGIPTLHPGPRDRSPTTPGTGRSSVRSSITWRSGDGATARRRRCRATSACPGCLELAGRLPVRWPARMPRSSGPGV